MLTEGSSYSGAFDAKGAAAYSKVYLSRNSAWNVTGDSHIDSARNGDKNAGISSLMDTRFIMIKTEKPMTGWAAKHCLCPAAANCNRNRKI